MSEPTPGDRTLPLEQAPNGAANCSDPRRPEVERAVEGEHAPEGATRSARLRQEQRQRWQDGDRLRVEDYLAADPTLRADADVVLDLLFGEVRLREEGGDFPTVEELVRRFPDLDPRIRFQFAIHAALHSRAPQALADAEPTEVTPSAGSGDALATVLPSDADHSPVTSGTAGAAGADHRAVPGYDILYELGRGGMGVVYKARQRSLNRLVALKMVLSGAHAGPTELDRFRSEAEAAAHVQHANLVQIYEIGEHEGRPFFSLELVDGGSLADLIKGHPQSPQLAAQMVETIARAAHAAHQAGIVHRDLKPANILLTPAGIPKITDFGLAKRLDGAARTATGDILGTPIYMAPEQAAGRVHQIGPATDVYALGVILYEMLTGRPPFLSEVSLDIVRQVISDEPVSPSRLQPRLPRDLVTICLKCLEKDPKKRYATAAALADDLRRFLDGEPITARPTSRVQRVVKWAKRRPALAALMVVSVLAALALLIGGWVYNVQLHQALGDAHDRAEETRRLLVRLNVSSGSRRLDEGDWFSALLWFSEALERDADYPQRVEMHRIRLASVLRRCPELKQLWFHKGAVGAGRFSPDGKRVVTASKDGAAHVWDVASGAAVGPALRHDSAIRYAELSPDGHRLLTCGTGVTRLWDVDTGKELTQPLRHDGHEGWARFSPDGTRVVTPGDNKAAWLWDVATGKRLPTRFAHGAPVMHAAFSNDGSALATAGKDGTGRVWHALTGTARTPPLHHECALTHVAFSPDGARLLTTSEDGTARLWDATSGKELTRPMKHHRTVRHGGFSADGQWVVTSSEDRAARVWSSRTGQPRVPALKHSGDVSQARFSPDGRWVVTCSDDNTARLWDAQTGELLPPWLMHHGSVNGVAVSRDGRLVLTFSSDTTARLWDVSAVTARLTEKEAHVPAPASGRGVKAVSPDGRLMVKGDEGHLAQVFDVATGAPVGPALEHGSYVTCVTFSPDSRVVATASDDNTARLWDARTGRLLTAPLKHLGTMRCVAFSPDGRLVATGSEDDTARVWDAQAGEPLTPPLPHPGPVSSAEFEKDGWAVVSTTFEGARRRWPLAREDRPIEELRRLAEVLASGRIDPERGFLPLEVERLRKLWNRMRTAAK
jgi:WD40 repeat protein/tRNA A-37 threonylcarbamoyl transferase component Bud32